ncbi:MAG: ABC transporter ATP-binding protein [Alphaproteobacteria bacterium]|jgi:lipoprotein-releasing system ATP-binding protein|nr:ABC transporter ATP-binding protein [Alphaproteobacteria bacterium]
MSEAALVLDAVERTFVQGEERLEVLRGASATVASGEIVALVGPSGAGKSTLLHIAGLLEWPDAGQVAIDGIACAGIGERGRTVVRRDKVGFVYQYHHLLPEFSALENVMLPQRIAGIAPASARVRAGELLRRLGLGERTSHRPARLSGGEQQRVAIARALANEPALLLADEPTGNLDQNTADGVFDELLAMVREHGLAALVATHNTELARRMDRILRLDAGVLVEN